MRHTFSKKKKRIGIVAFLALSATLAYCAMPSTEPDRTGIVFDVTNDRPVEGAYVMAVYYESGSTPFGHSGHWCVKTKGMYTGKDGAFRFPGGRPNNPVVSAIKPDFTEAGSSESRRPHPWVSTWWGGSYAPFDPDLYLKPQDPAKPSFQLGGMKCERPQMREDVVANIEYLKIKIAEYIKYGNRLDAIDAVRGMQQQLESLP